MWSFVNPQTARRRSPVPAVVGGVTAPPLDVPSHELHEARLTPTHRRRARSLRLCNRIAALNRKKGLSCGLTPPAPSDMPIGGSREVASALPGCHPTPANCTDFGQRRRRARPNGVNPSALANRKARRSARHASPQRYLGTARTPRSAATRMTWRCSSLARASDQQSCSSARRSPSRSHGHFQTSAVRSSFAFSEMIALQKPPCRTAARLPNWNGAHE